MGEYRLRETPDGHKTLVYINSREIKLHSSYNPIKEAERSVNSFSKGRANCIIVCGLGLGYHVQILKKKFPDCIITVIEKDTSVIKIAKDTFPEYLNDVTIINSNMDMAGFFEETNMTTFRGATFFIHRPSYLLYKNFYDKFIIDVNEFISSKLSDLLTRFEFEEKWIENILNNINRIFSSVPVKNLFGRFKNYPGIIVSGGPSLRKNIRFLHSFRDKALIVCVDTAFMVLLKNGINPHLVMTLDSQKHSLKHFLGFTDYHSALIADLVSYPRVIDSYKGKNIISSTSKYYNDEEGNLKRETSPLMDWIEDYISPIGDIQSGGSVATSAFDLLLNLGCSPIILVGQDLAYTGREIHCSGTYHNAEWIPKTSRFLTLDTFNQNIIRKRKIKYVEAYNSAGQVISDFVFDLYRRWFEDSAAKVSIPVINATEGGAKISNTQECSLELLIHKTPEPLESPDHIIKIALSQNVNNNPRPLYQGMISAIESISELKRLSENRLNEKNISDEMIYNLINKDSISKIITPFLKKTYVYLSRHPELCRQKASRLFITDVITASNKILKLLDAGKRSLETIR